ncbi:MAG: PEGA domain-containing protein [Myxococcales bacterium]
MKLPLAAALLAFAAPALAGKPSAAAFAFAASGAKPAEVDELQAEATAALLRDAPLAGVDPADRLDSRGEAGRAAAARLGAAKMKAALAAFDNLDLAAAVDGFGEAASAFASADVHRSFDSYVQALVWQAASRWVNGDHDAAREELLHVFSEAPQAALDKSAFPPDLMEEADRDRGEAAAAAPIELQISSEPEGLVSIDGRLQGPSPVEVKLPPGRHLVVVSAPGYAVASQRTQGPRADFRLSPLPERDWLEGQRKAAAAHFESSDRMAPLRQVMDRLGVDQLLAVTIEGAGDARSVVAGRFASDGHVLAFVRQPLAAGATPAAAAAEALKAALAQDLPRGPGGKPVTETGLEGGGFHLNLGQHGIAAIVGGVGLAAIVAGSIFGALELQQRSGYLGTPQTNVTLSQSYRSTGDSFAIASDVLDIVGVVGLGAAVAVWLWPKGSSAPASEKTDVFGVAPIPLPGGGVLAATGTF